jgi:hypothetical protein
MGESDAHLLIGARQKKYACPGSAVLLHSRSENLMGVVEGEGGPRPGDSPDSFAPFLSANNPVRTTNFLI